ncbi:MAG: hypothetical protein PHY94_07565, partial [Candidatus Omnitrophica bacterium]|nr:hypothetical protein [Candidatus Omnitrophota bacterium]
DLENNLALVKLGEGGLSTTGFADLNKTKMGERVLLLEMEFEGSLNGAKAPNALAAKLKSKALTGPRN